MKQWVDSNFEFVHEGLSSNMLAGCLVHTQMSQHCCEDFSSSGVACRMPYMYHAAAEFMPIFSKLESVFSTFFVASLQA